MSILDDKTLGSAREDSWIWRDPHISMYIVKLAYAILSKSHIKTSSAMFRDLWGLLAPLLAQ